MSDQSPASTSSKESKEDFSKVIERKGNVHSCLFFIHSCLFFFILKEKQEVVRSIIQTMKVQQHNLLLLGKNKTKT